MTSDVAFKFWKIELTKKQLEERCSRKKKLLALNLCLHLAIFFATNETPQASH